MGQKVLLQITDMSKGFAGVQALLGVSFELLVGEVHALVGENGAGKSTLMKILGGICRADSGHMQFLGEDYSPRSPRDALDRGVAIVHQELMMMEHLTVAQNIFIGRENVRAGGLLLDERAQNRRAAQLFEQLGIAIDPTEKVAKLTVGKQQMVEIARAISHDLKLLVLDEPTASLAESEVEELFTIVRRLADRGVGFIYISHRLKEIEQIADRVTVLRDGKYVGTAKVGEISPQQLIQMMVGREIYTAQKLRSTVAAEAKVVLEVRNLCLPPAVRGVSFSLHQGEILGLAGLMGAGRTETVRAVFGADCPRSGEIYRNGQRVEIHSPMDAVRYGMGYISEDRKRFGLALTRSVADNILLATWDKFSRMGFLRFGRVQQVSSEYVGRLRVKTPSVEQLLLGLSGGNQQKVVIARWMLRDCEVLIFDEPTRGIDVGARSEIYALINELVRKEGKSMILISSDLTELLHLSDRVVVLREGQVTANLDISGVTQDRIMYHATHAVAASN